MGAMDRAIKFMFEINRLHFVPLLSYIYFIFVPRKDDAFFP